MTKVRLLILILLSSIAIDCAVGLQELWARGQFRYDLPPGESIRLSLGRMTSMPNGVVFIGGSYATLSDSLSTCMLISRDGGKTWTDAQLKFARSTIGPMVSHGSRMVWALVLSNVEGTQAPERLLISRDAGVYWEEVAWMWGIDGPLAQVDDFRFFDETHGMIWLNNSLGKGQTLETSDAGHSWTPLWSTSRAMDEDPPEAQGDDPGKAVPGSGFFPEVSHTKVSDRGEWYTLRLVTIWRDSGGLVRSDEWLTRCSRLQCRQTYGVQRLDISARKSEEHDRSEQWQTISEIPVNYEIVAGSLRPLDR